MNFISRTNYEIHKEHLRTLKLRMSIFEKSYPEMAGKSCKELLRLPIRRTEREEAAVLKADILAHELYFSSFSAHNSTAELVRKAYGSEATFLYKLGKFAEECGERFAFIYADGKAVRVRGGDEWSLLRIDEGPLVIDLSEHAYFLDYGFDKKAYIKNLLPYLDLSLLDKKLSRKD